jgi:hypothetical protein
MAGHIATAKATDWCTPESVLAPVREFLGRISLDPCSNDRSTVGAEVRWSLPADGLAPPWRGTVYVNPPYGAGLDRWVEKSSWEAHELRRCEVVMLLPAAVDTRMWQDVLFPTAAAVCFWRGRIRFVGAKAAAPMACALAYWGPRAQRFAAVFEKHGRVVRP